MAFDLPRRREVVRGEGAVTYLTCITLSTVWRTASCLTRPSYTHIDTEGEERIGSKGNLEDYSRTAAGDGVRPLSSSFANLTTSARQPCSSSGDDTRGMAMVGA